MFIGLYGNAVHSFVKKIKTLSSASKVIKFLLENDMFTYIYFALKNQLYARFHSKKNSYFVFVPYTYTYTLTLLI